MTGAGVRWRGVAWLMATVVVAVGGCRRTPDEVRIRQAVDSAAAAARERDGGAFGKWLSDDFDAGEGAFDRRGLPNLLRMMRWRDERLDVLVGPVTVRPQGQRYIATFTVTMGSGGRLLPAHLGVYHVTTAWRLENGRWRCYHATWKR